MQGVLEALDGERDVRFKTIKQIYAMYLFYLFYDRLLLCQMLYIHVILSFMPWDGLLPS